MRRDNDTLDALRIVRFGPEALDCAVDRPRALKYLGQRDAELTSELSTRLDAAIELCTTTAHPRGIARSLAIASACNDEVTLAGSTLVLTGRNITHHLDGCTLVCLLAVTLGMQTERTLLRLQSTNPLDALLFDACASSMAEAAAQQASTIADALATQAGFTTTKRFSPGFGDLPLSVQPALLATIGADATLGIHTGSAHLMTPMKSVTAVIGLKPAALAKGR